MQRISGWKDLERYGIVPLTGEACGLTYRILCDVTERGKATLEKCLGCSLQLPRSWNQGSAKAPHVGAVMLAPELLVPISVFALLEAGCTEVWAYQDHNLLGIEPSDPAEHIVAYRKLHADALSRTFAYRGTAGDRNVHGLTGRVT